MESLSPQPEKKPDTLPQPLPFSYFFNIAKTLKKLGINLSFLNKSTPHCRHSTGCLNNILSGTLQSFAIGYLIKTAINLLSVVVAFKKLLRQPWLLIFALFSKESARFAIFPALYTFIVKGTICLLRTLLKREEKWFSFVSGALAGFFSIQANPTKDKAIWGLFLFSRALDTIYRHLINHNKIKKIPLDYMLLFGLANMVTGYAFAIEPDCNPHGLNKFYMQFAQMNTNDRIFREAWIQKKKNQLGF